MLPEPVKATPLPARSTSAPVLVCHVLEVVTRPLPVRVDMMSNLAVDPMAVVLTASWVPPLMVVQLTPVMPAAVMAAFMLVAIDVSCSLLEVAYEAVTPPTRMLIVSVGLSLPEPWTALVTLAVAGAGVMLSAQLAAVIDLLL